MRQLKWVIYGVLALLLVWRIVVVNLSQHLAAEGSQAATQWKRDTPEALLKNAATMAQTDSKQARSLAVDAALANPVDGRAFLILALLWEQEGKAALAGNAATTANFLAPLDAEVQLPLGSFWAQRGQPVQALQHWSAALKARPALAPTLYPVMLEIADTPQMRPAFVRAISDAPAWWGSFFMYALRNAKHEDTLKAIYSARASLASHDERRAYVDHLLSAGLTTDAYFVWLNGLKASEVSALGYVYDGGFEQEIADEGFGWRPAAGKGFRLAAEPTYGDSGEKALHVSLQEAPTSRHLLQQFLMLDAGRYHFRGKVRLDSIAAGKGLQWVVSCAGADGATMLASSEHFIGADEWKRFETELEVPAGSCELQKLRLHIDAGPGDDLSAFAGSAWFDDLEMVKFD